MQQVRSNKKGARGCELATSMKIRSMWDIGTSLCNTWHFFICIAPRGLARDQARSERCVTRW